MCNQQRNAQSLYSETVSWTQSVGTSVRLWCLHYTVSALSHAPSHAPAQPWFQKHLWSWCWNTVGGAQAYENWPIGADLGFQKGDLNETSTKTEHLDRRWLGAATMDSMRKIVCFLNIKACEHFLVDTQNKYMNLKMTLKYLLPQWMGCGYMLND